MQASLSYKHAIMPRESLNADLTVDKNLTLKSSHHYLTKLCKTPFNMSTIESTPNDLWDSLACLHLMLCLEAPVEARSNSSHSYTSLLSQVKKKTALKNQKDETAVI
jgi:hypothetical protein